MSVTRSEYLSISMAAKCICFVILHLFILSYCKSGFYLDFHKTDHGRSPWAQRAKTNNAIAKTTGAQRPTDTRSDSRLGDLASSGTIPILTVIPLVQAEIPSTKYNAEQAFVTANFATASEDDKIDKLYNSDITENDKSDKTYKMGAITTTIVKDNGKIDSKLDSDTKIDDTNDKLRHFDLIITVDDETTETEGEGIKEEERVEVTHVTGTSVKLDTDGLDDYMSDNKINWNVNNIQRQIEASYIENNITVQAIGSEHVPSLDNGSAPAFQWHVGVYSKNWSPYMQICGGSLVKRDVVISAAHCFWDSVSGQQPASLFAVAGGKLYRPWNDLHDIYAQHSDVSEINLPVRFRGSDTSFQDDIAILRLSSAFTYAPGVQSVCVNFGEEFDREQLQPGNLGTVCGWGLTEENGLPSQRLNYLRLPYVDVEDCFTASDPSFYKYITSDKICAGTQTGKALCRGDSGGGLVFFSNSETPYLRGIASTAARNENLCNAYALATFTHIYAHRSFLRDNEPDIEKECAPRINSSKPVEDTGCRKYCRFRGRRCRNCCRRTKACCRNKERYHWC